MSPLPSRVLRRGRRPAVLIAAVIALSGPLAGAAVAGGSAQAQPVRNGLRSAAVRSAAQAAAPVTITGPGGHSVEVTPGDLTGIRSGDVVHLHFAGLKPFEFIDLGTCAADIPAGTIDPISLVLPGCGGQLNTGLPGTLDADASGPGSSTVVSQGYARTDGTVDIDFLIGRGEAFSPDVYRFADGSPEQSLKITCDETHPCRIGFEVFNNSFGPIWQDVSTPSLLFSPVDRAADTGGCDGLGTDIVTGYGPERLLGLLSALNRGSCEAIPGPVPLSFVPSGESDRLPRDP